MSTRKDMVSFDCGACVFHRSHIRKRYSGRINKFRSIFCLPLSRGRNPAVQLPPDAPGTQPAELLQSFHSCLKRFICTEFRRVLFHVRRYHFCSSIDHLTQITAVKILTDKLSKILMIKLCIFPVFKNPRKHWPVFGRSIPSKSSILKSLPLPRPPPKLMPSGL